MSGEWVPQPSA